MLFKSVVLLVLYISWAEAIVFTTYTLLGTWAAFSNPPLLFFKRNNPGYGTVVKVMGDGLSDSNGKSIKSGTLLTMQTSGKCPVLCLKSGSVYSAIIYPKMIGPEGKYVNINSEGAYKPDTRSQCMKWQTLERCDTDYCVFYNSHRNEFAAHCSGFLVS